MGKRKSHKKGGSLKGRLLSLVLVAVVPLLGITIYLIISLVNYSEAYDEIVSNMTIANSYNLDFKDQLDESTYKLVVGAVTFENIDKDTSGFRNPYALIRELRNDFTSLLRISTDSESRMWLQRLLRNLNTLEERVKDIDANLEEGGHYDENIAMLDDNIYIMTELVQEDIQNYIYHQAQSMESLKQALKQRIETFIIVVTIILVLVLLLVIVISIQISESISEPVQELVKVTGEISKGDFEIRAKKADTIELERLSDSVNDMAMNLETMVSQIKEDEAKMRRSELRLLQEQINPHFLYNTLDTIVWFIESKQSKEAEEMVVSLSDFFRMVLSHGKEYISIEEEEKHIRSYLQIQRARYQDILDYEIQIAPQLYPYQIQKMTLQPIVENALYHGIKYKRAKGTILITGQMQEKVILLQVMDDGIGMEEADLLHLREEISRPCKETESGFGLANVNERIKMNFGSEYGITITSKKNEGTTITVALPAILVSEGKEDKNDK